MCIVVNLLPYGVSVNQSSDYILREAHFVRLREEDKDLLNKTLAVK